MMTTTQDSLMTAAKNIRRELKAAFPGTVFSVKSKRFSMGDSISVSWTDGPTDKAVSEIVGKYQEGSFNGMEDIYEYDNSRDESLGGTKYLHTRREYSDSLVESALIALRTRYPGNEFNGTAEDFRMGRLYTVNPFGGDMSLCTMIRRQLENGAI